MVFSSLTFLFLYLPFVLGIYYCTPRRLRNAFLFLANLVFYGWGEPVFLCVMLLSIFSNYIFGILIDRNRDHIKRKKCFLILSIVISLGLLGLFKYTNFIVEMLSVIPAFAWMEDAVPLIPLPIGISFYIFQAMSYAIDVYRGDTASQKSFVIFGTYVSLFPQLIAGPIVRYKDVEQQLIDQERESRSQFAWGIRIFIIGLAKKTLIANQMGLLWDTLRPTAAENGLLGVWLGTIAFTLQIYFDFSGYSDMARGLGGMFGFRFLENFNYPYISKSITEFWRRWHISLSTWFRDYVYIPLGGNRKGGFRLILNLLAVWSLTGLWHGASLNFLLWGLYYFLFLTLEKFFLLDLLKRLPKAMTHVYAMLIVMVGWMLFYFVDFSDLTEYLGLMFSLKKGLLSDHSASILLSYLPLIAASVFAALPAGKNIYGMFREKSCFVWIEPGFYLILMLLCTAALASQSYNPFLYFRF